MRLAGLNRTLFQPGDRLCCALSGGADSTALVLALVEANREKESLGLVLSAIHIHHGLRGLEADGDEAFVRQLCAGHEVPLAVQHVDTPARQQAEREGLEEAARELRHAAFRDLLTSGQADAIATAHTLDDQAETVVMKLLRGAWTEGLAGISPVLDLAASRRGTTTGRAEPQRPREALPSLRILRPMLGVRRAEVERFLRERNQSWREDSTNAELHFTRNRIRHELMPLLRSFNPAIDDSLARTAEIARAEEIYWEAEIARLLPGLVLPGKPVRGGGRAVSTAAGERSLAIELHRLEAQPKAVRRRLIRAAAGSLGCRIDAEETAKLLGLAGLLEFPGLSARQGARLELSGGLRAERSPRELRLSRISNRDITKKV